MSVAANQARLMTLTARQHDLELRAQNISAEKMIWTMQSQSVATTYSSTLNSLGQNPNATDQDYSNAQNTYSLAMQVLSSKEKMLDMELTQINTEHTAIKTEYDAIKSLISDNVEKSFNVFG